MEFEIIGFDKLNKSFDNASKNFDKECDKLLVKVGNMFLSKVKLKTPVDTGVARRNWRMTKRTKEVIISNNTDYIIYLNYPHRTRGGKSMVEGHYMVERTMEEIDEEFDGIFDTMIENLFE